jgi:hypothetical protein
MLRERARLEGGLSPTSYTPLVPGAAQRAILREVARGAQAPTVIREPRYRRILAVWRTPANGSGRDPTGPLPASVEPRARAAAGTTVADQVASVRSVPRPRRDVQAGNERHSRVKVANELVVVPNVAQVVAIASQVVANACEDVSFAS